MRHAPLALLLLLAALAGCSPAASVWTPGVHVPQWRSERVVDLTDPKQRSSVHLELAWACLLHGHDCLALRENAEAGVRAAPDMALAQLTRALARQAHADIGHRSQAWLELLLWLADPAPGDSSVRRHDLLRTLACESLGRLATRDRAAVQQRIAALSLGVEGALLEGPALHRWRRRAAIAGLLSGRLVADLGARGTSPLVPSLRWRRAPVAARMYTGLRRLKTPPVVKLADPLPLAPDDAALPAVLRRGRHLLPAARPGVYAFAGGWQLPRSGHWQLVVQTDRPFRVWLNGRELAPRGHRVGANRSLLVHKTHLNSGPQRIQLALALSSPGAALDVALLAAEPARKRPASEPWPAPVEAVLDALGAAPLGAGSDLAARWPQAPIVALVGLDRGAALEVERRASAELLDRVLDVLPDHVDARIDRAGRAREEGNTSLARRLLAPLSLRADSGSDGAALGRRADLRLEQAWQHLSAGLGDLAMGAVADLIRAQPNDCAVWRQAVMVGQDTLDRAALRRLLARARPCPPGHGALTQALTLVGRLEEARKSALLASRQPASRDTHRQRARQLAETLNLAEPATAAAASEASERAIAGLWRRAQRRLAAGESRAARADLRRVLLGRHRNTELRRQAWQLGARLPWPQAVLDGAAIAAAARGSGGDSAMTWLLDHEIAVLLPGGGALRRVHQVVQVHAVEAAEAVGEISVPADAELLFARTITADGTVVLPADTPDKESVSLRQVGPGAVVEYAQIQFVEAEDPATGATRLPPFLFRSTDGPVRRSEYVVLAPKGMSARLDASPSAPKPETASAQGWRVWTFRHPPSPRLRPEPRANRPEWQQPMVRVSQGATIASVIGSMEEALAAHDREDDPLLKPWHRRAQAAGHDVQRWRRLVGQIAANVEQRRSGLMPGHPAAALRSGRGDRASLLYHLGRFAGVHVCLARITPLSRQPAYGAPDPRDFSLDAVMMRLPVGGDGATRDVWFDTAIDGGLVDSLRPGLRRRPALLLGCGGQAGDRVIRTPDLGAANDQREVRVELDWQADGSVSARVSDTMRGAMAALIRSWLRQADADQRRALLQQLAGPAFPGYELRLQEASPMADDRQPLVLRYSATAAADPARRGALDLALYPADLGRIYARLAKRRTAMRVGHALDVRVHLQVRNHGAPLAHAPTALEVAHPMVQYHRRARLVDQTLLLERSLRSQMGIVPPTDYPLLAGQLRRVDGADRLRLERHAKVPANR